MSADTSSAPRVWITAAGASRRVGTCKALATRDGELAFERIARVVRGSFETPPLIITGADHAAISAAVARVGARVELLHNPDWQRGRASGIAHAARVLGPCDALVWPIDCPAVDAATVAALLARWNELERPQRGWLAPYCEVARARRYGHPVWVGMELLSLLTVANEPLSLRELRARADPLDAVLVPDHAVLDDFDTREDWRRNGWTLD